MNKFSTRRKALLVVTTWGHGTVLRLIIELIFRPAPEWGPIFGANVENNDEDDESNFESESHKLLEENYSFDSHTTIFHAGSINRDNTLRKLVFKIISILNQIEFHLIQNWKENCHHDHIPFNVKGNGNIVLSV